MEQATSSRDQLIYAPQPPSDDDPWQSEEESDSDIDPAHESTVAAPYVGLDPFETVDQDDYLEIRAEATINSRVQ